MTVTKCDICNNEYNHKEKHHSIKIPEFDGNYISKSVIAFDDVCPACASKILDYIDRIKGAHK